MQLQDSHNGGCGLHDLSTLGDEQRLRIQGTTLLGMSEGEYRSTASLA